MFFINMSTNIQLKLILLLVLPSCPAHSIFIASTGLADAAL